MKKSYNKAFTLVELLAVIVILAIILVIAVPKIMSVITDSKKSSLETSAKMIASAAEKTKMQNIVLGKENEDITCSSVAKLNSNDYDLDNCTITFDTNNNASVNINGKGKFSGLSVCGGTKTQATAQTEACVLEIDTKYFSYEIVDDTQTVEVVDVSKCTNYLVEKGCSSTPENQKSECEGQAEMLCLGENIGKASIDLMVNNGIIPSMDFEDAGISLSSGNISITGYNIKGGTDVIIPSTIDGYIVTGISDYAFTSSGIIPEVISNNKRYNVNNLLKNNVEYEVEKVVQSVEGLGIKSVVIPNTVTTIGEFAFSDNPLTKVYLENPNIEIGTCAFGFKEGITIHNLPDTYLCS